jgi:uncharacterized protein YdeI (YjbR/CyaY-like superfamily)
MAELEIGGQPVIGFATVAECESWFERHHADHRGFWMKIGKAGGTRSVTYPEALAVALCFGWIDGQKRGLDEQHWLQRFTPRGPRSKWSQVNRDKAEALIEFGAMRPAGLREVERARSDGRWAAAYESQGNATVPADLAEALAADPEAAAFFATLSGVNRYAILYRIHDAKRPETRARRIEKFVAMCREHKTIH